MRMPFQVHGSSSHPCGVVVRPSARFLTHDVSFLWRAHEDGSLEELLLLSVGTDSRDHLRDLGLVRRKLEDLRDGQDHRRKDGDRYAKNMGHVRDRGDPRNVPGGGGGPQSDVTAPSIDASIASSRV